MRKKISVLLLAVALVLAAVIGAGCKNKTEPAVTVINTTSTYTSVEFELQIDDPDNVLTVEKIELYSGNQLVKIADNVDVRVFDGLTSGTVYTVSVTYKYSLGKRKGEQTDVAKADITTQTKSEPTVEFARVLSGLTYLEFELSVTDPENLVTVTKIELYRGDQAVQTAENADVRKFENLYNNMEYKIEVTYTYDLGDGNGVQTKTVSASKVTEAKALPDVKIQNVLSVANGVNFDLRVTDEENVLVALNSSDSNDEHSTPLHIFNTEILLNGAVVKNVDMPDTPTNAEEAKAYTLNCSATELLTATKYVLRVTYYYDLADGYGLREETVSAEFSTATDGVEVQSLQVIGKNAVKSGEEITLNVTFSNPQNIVISQIFVNGVNATVISNDNLGATVKVVPNEVGRTDLFVDKLVYSLNGATVNYLTESDIGVQCCVYGDLDVTFAGVANGNNLADAGIYFTFENKADYSIYSVNGQNNFMRISNGEYYVFANSVYSITYGCAGYENVTKAFNFACSNADSLAQTVVDGGVTYAVLGSKYVALSATADATEIALKPNTVIIKANAFGNCNNVEKITLNAELLFIEQNAFADSVSGGLDLYFNGTVTDWCNIIFANAASNPMRLANDVYFYSVKDNSFVLKTEITISNSVFEIKPFAFYGWSSLRTVNIAQDIQKIGDYAFASTGVTVVNYEMISNDEEEGDLGSIVIGENAFPQNCVVNYGVSIANEDMPNPEV